MELESCFGKIQIVETNSLSHTIKLGVGKYRIALNDEGDLFHELIHVAIADVVKDHRMNEMVTTRISDLFESLIIKNTAEMLLFLQNLKGVINVRH